MRPIEARIISNEHLVQNVFRLTLQTPEVAETARPGQFVHLCLSHSSDPLLRRPFGIHGVHSSDSLVQVLYQVVGRGTELLAGGSLGPSLSLLGPLGRGFTVPPPGTPVALIAGGLGIAPLAFLMRVLAREGCRGTLFQGARNRDLLLGSEDTGMLGYEYRPATDDGSFGFSGSVVDLAAPLLDQYSFVYAAGPSAMLKALCTVLARHDIDGEVSVEERMGCGIGSCLCCSVPVRGYQQKYARTCADGPVFRAREVVWE